MTIVGERNYQWNDHRANLQILRDAKFNYRYKLTVDGRTFSGEVVDTYNEALEAGQAKISEHLNA